MPGRTTEAFPSALAAPFFLSFFFSWSREKNEFLFQQLSPEGETLPLSTFHFSSTCPRILHGVGSSNIL